MILYALAFSPSLIPMENTNLQLPPGFRFHPSDEELIVHYLLRKVNSRPLPALIIANIDVYEYNPWELPNKALFGEDEWYFFSPRKRKYSRGARTNRAAASGCWKATGMNQPILTSCGSKSIGVKKALVFYSGPPPKRVKTDWTMIEYTLLDVTTSSTSKRPIIPNPKCKDEERHINLVDYVRKISDISESPKKNRLQSIIMQMGPSLPCSMDDWVLCRIRQKGNVWRNAYQGRDSCSMQPPSYSPKIEGLLHTSTSNNADSIKDYRFRESPLLDLIRTGAAPPNSEVDSEGSRGDHFTSANGDGSNGVKSPLTISSLDSYFNPSEGALGLENEYENFISNEKPAESEIDNLPATTLPAYYGINSYSQNYCSQFDNFNPKHSTISELQQIIDFSFIESIDSYDTLSQIIPS